MRTLVKKVRLAVENQEAEAAQVALKDATKMISHVASKGVIKKTTASRKVSRLTKLVNTLQGG